MGKFEGKTVAVTGSGTGLAIAQRFVGEGAVVYLLGRRDVLDVALRRLGPNIRAVRGSVTEVADLKRLSDDVRTERG